MRNADRHRWSVRDDVAALYVYKFGHRRLASSFAEVAELVGVPPASFRMRVGNFKALDGPGGLSNASRQSQEVFARYGSATEAELRAIAFPAHG
jgi:hypothetical protein